MRFVRRWRNDIWFLAAVFIVVVGLDAAVKVSAAMSPVHLTTAWKLRSDVLPGQTVDSSVVEAVDVRDGEPVLRSIPDGAIFVHGMGAGDVIRPDDVAPASSYRTVPLDFKIAPDLVPGEYIDVYGIGTSVTGTDGQPATGTASPALTLLGRRLAVVSVGTHVLVDVPTSTANAWAYVVENQQQLVAFVSSAGGGCAQPVPETLGDAIRMLNQAATNGTGKAPSGCSTGGGDG